jgi:hypothetical protein
LRAAIVLREQQGRKVAWWPVTTEHRRVRLVHKAFEVNEGREELDKRRQLELESPQQDAVQIHLESLSAHGCLNFVVVAVHNLLVEIDGG